MNTKNLRSTLITILTFALTSNALALDLKSSDIEDGGILKMDQVFNSFGCTGQNKSPELNWSNVPEQTKSLAINVYDPDAPTGSGWWHWTVFNIPTSTKSLPANASANKKVLPKGSIQGRTDYGTSAFGGACPPEGDKAHRYIITLYALDVEKLDLDQNASGALVGYFLNKHVIEKSSITATFGRQKN